MDTFSTPLCPILVGRDDLLDLADRHLSEASAGRGQFLLLAGEAGIGKTRLIGAIDRRALAQGFITVGGWLAPQDRDVPAASILDMARSMLRMPAFAELGQHLLRLRDEAVTAEHARRRMLVMDVVERIRESIHGPTMFDFEDLQWADDLSLEIIAEVARATRELPLLVLGAYRTEDVPPGASLRDWRARLLTQRLAEEVGLAPLTREQTGTVATLVLATGLPAPREVVDAIYERTDGIPLHIEELLGAIPLEARSDVDAIRAVAVPGTLEDAVLARMAQRSPEAQAVARAGAVIGRCFGTEVLAGIMNVPPDTLDEPLRELIDHAVLEGPGLREVYDFRHQLLRDALYRSTAPRDRRRFHALAGEFCAQLEGASEVHASLHYERAGLTQAAFTSAREGARQAARLSAHREAFELYRRAVDNAPPDLTPADRGELLMAYANEAAAIEAYDIAEPAVVDAERSFRVAGRPLDANRALTVLMSIWRRTGHPISERLVLANKMLSELAGQPAGRERDQQRGDTLALLAIAHIDRFALDEARHALDEMRSIAGSLEDPERIGVADWLGGKVNTMAGDIAVGLTAIERAAQGLEHGGFEDSLGAYRDGTELAVRYLEYGQAERFIAEGLRYADTVQQSHCAHVMSANRALLAWAGGAWDEATIRAEQAIADRGCGRASSTARWPLGYVALGRGDFDRARTVLSEALAFADGSEAIDLMLPASWGLAETALLAGDPADAVTRCEAAVVLADEVGQPVLLIPFVVTGVRAYQAGGRPEEAGRWLERCETRLSGVSAVARPALEHGRGLVALAAGSVGAARRELESAVRGWVERGRTWEATWCRLDLASSLVRSNRFAAAVAVASEVRKSAARLESPSLLARADALIRQARGHVADDEPWRPLTAREFEVARLITEGRTNAQIGTSLGIASKTASSHVEHILAKLGASRRAEIAAWASHVKVNATSR